MSLEGPTVTLKNKRDMSIIFFGSDQEFFAVVLELNYGRIHLPHLQTRNYIIGLTF